MNREHIGIGFFSFFFEITFRDIRTETTRINTHHINRRFTLDNPLCQLPTGTTGGSHTKGVAFVEPEILQTRCRANNRVAIRGIGNRAVIDFLDTHFTKGRNTCNRGFDIRHQAFEVFLKQLIFAFIRRTVLIANRCTDLVRPEQQAAIFLAHIP